MSDKFPVLNNTKYPDCPTHVNWSKLSEKRADDNHGQTLKRLAERHGLCPEEIVCNLLDISYCEFKKLKMPLDEVMAKVRDIAK